MRRNHPFEFLGSPEFKEVVIVRDKKEFYKTKISPSTPPGYLFVERVNVFKVLVQTKHGRLNLEVDKDTYSSVCVGGKILISYRLGRSSQKLSGKIILDH